MQQSNIMLSQKHKDGECEISMRYPMCDFDTIKNLKDCQRLFLFQKLDDQSEIIKLTIFEKTQNKVLGNVLYQLERLHIIFKKSLDQQKNTYLNQDNIIVLFLLSIKIEIDFLKFQITRFLLPKAFKTYLSCTEYKMPTQEEYKSLFRKICEDFNINYEQKIRNEIRKQDFYELLQRISTNPITQQNQNKLKQFQESQTTNQAQLNVNLEEQKQEIQYEESILDNLVLNQSQASISNYQKYESLQSQSTQNSSQIDGSESEIRKALNDSPSIIVDNQIKVDSTIAPITKKIILRKITNLPQQIRISKIKHVKSLIKQQNQEIILSKCSDSMIPLGKDNIIFYNQKYDVKLQKQYNKRIQYIGVLDYNYELQETGLFKQIDLKVEYEGQFEYGVYSGLGKQTFLNQRCEGTFRQGQKQGFLTVTNLKSQQILYIQYQYDVQKQYFQNEQTFNQQKQRQTQNEYLIEKEIIESKYLTLSNMTLRTLNVGQWLQEKIIDYYLEEMQNHYKQLHKDQVNYKIFNTGNSQDIFSSNLNYNNFDFDQIQQLISLKNLKQHLESKQISTTTQTTQRNQINRTIFAMNLNRSHFITIAIELSGIYILNSLPSDLVQLCEIFKQAFKQINIDLDYEPEDYQIQIHEQKDYYSCGVQTCYVINQLIKHHNVPIKDIIFNNTTKEIEKYTTHIKNVILTRNSIHINRQIL